MNIEDLHVPVRVVDPLGEGEIAGDGDWELPAAVVKVRGIGQRDGVSTDGGNGVAKGLPGLRWQPFEELDDFDRDEEPLLHGSGFETLIELLKRGPVSRADKVPGNPLEQVALLFWETNALTKRWLP